MMKRISLLLGHTVSISFRTEDANQNAMKNTIFGPECSIIICMFLCQSVQIRTYSIFTETYSIKKIGSGALTSDSPSIKILPDDQFVGKMFVANSEIS